MASLSKKTKRIVAAITTAALILSLAQVAMADGRARNVILMISDGQGFNTIRATDCYTGEQGPYAGFPVRGSINTSSAGPAGGEACKPYDPTRMWKDFNYQMACATDSASAATAMFSGVKVYDHQLNKTGTGTNLTTFFEFAAGQGKATGVVSTVNVAHATPAAVAAHTTNRRDYETIARQMIGSRLDVIMGTGHPFYDNDGRPVAADYRIVGSRANWEALKNGAGGRVFMETKADFEALAHGMPAIRKVTGIARVRDTLQAERSGGRKSPMNQDVPNLATMVKGALTVLGRHAAGFALMIEGGAVDWANHKNRLERAMEEQTDFNEAVKAVNHYLDGNTNGNNWNNTLLIVTADHETGGLWGAAGRFAPVGDNGAGRLPTAVYNSTHHTAGLVPFFAKGADAELFEAFLTARDDQVAARYNVDAAFNRYIDNTDICKVMKAASGRPVMSR